MRKTIKIVVLASLCLTFKAGAQNTSVTIQPLNIGDTVSKAIWNTPLQIINHPEGKRTLTLNSYKGKPIILDFWATSCGSCVMAMPKLNQEQQQFADSILILPVSYEKKKQAQLSFSHNRILKSSKLGTVIEDVRLKQFFPHEYISHLVWIDKNGIVRAFTGTDYLTEENIRHILQNEAINWPVKRDLPDYDYTRPLLTLNKDKLPSWAYPKKIYYNTLTGHLNNVTFMYNLAIDTPNSRKQISIINQSILQLYLKANGLFSFPLSHVLLEVSNPERYHYSSNKEFKESWSLKNTYCYQAAFPMQTDDEQQKNKMLSDLDFYFNSHCRMEERMMTCLVIEQTNPSARYKKPEAVHPPDFTSQPIKITDLTDHLNQILLSKPVFDESGQGERSIVLEKDELYHLEALNKKLVKYGLQLRETQKQVKIFVLSSPKESYTNNSSIYNP